MKEKMETKTVELVNYNNINIKYQQDTFKAMDKRKKKVLNYQ